MNKIIKGIHGISVALSWVASAGLFAMMLMTFLNVIGRYFVNKPIIGTQDLCEQFMILVVYGALGYVTMQKRHIAVDLLVEKLTLNGKRIMLIVANLISLVVLIPMSVSLSKAAAHRAMHLYMTTATIKLPVAPFYIFAAFGAVILCLEIIIDIVNYIRGTGGDA